jgi:N-dimethylarginine dimethylaminohydrolase
MPERSAEESPFASWFEDAGFEVAPLSGTDPYEGEGDTLFTAR